MTRQEILDFNHKKAIDTELKYLKDKKELNKTELLLIRELEDKYTPLDYKYGVLVGYYLKEVDNE